MKMYPTKAFILLFVLLIGSLTTLPLALADTEGSEPGVKRSLPERGFCGRASTVTLTIEPPQRTDSWLLVEDIPEALTVSDVDRSNNGAYNESRHRIEWVSTNGLPATHTYNVTIPEDAEDSTVFEFRGEFRFYPMMDERTEVLGRIGLNVDCVDEPPEVEGGAVMRSLPESARCGDIVPVSLSVDPGTGHGAWFLDEGPPKGFTVDGFDPIHNGDYGDETHRLKWISLRAAEADLGYNLSIPADAEKGMLTFTGTYVLTPGMQQPAQIQGDDTLRVTCGSAGLVLLSLALIPLATMGGIFYVRRRGAAHGGTREGPEGP